jgi:uncharacterized protein (TIGR02145 family)
VCYTFSNAVNKKGSKMKKPLIILALTLGLANTTHAEPLSPTQLHAVLGVMTNFILDDVITHNGTSYGTVTSPYTGRVWLDRNIGASKVCTSLDDIGCYGDYYQWGRNYDGHQKSSSFDYPTLANNVTNVGHGDFITNGTAPYDWASVDATGAERTINWTATDGSSVCPTGFRVPIIAELSAELIDVGSANIQDNIDAFNSFLKFPSAGYRKGDLAVLATQGFWGYVWSSSVNGSSSQRFGFGSFFVGANDLNRANGYPIRCIKGKTHKHNGTTYGEVISPYTGKVWLDRNLGANRVCTSLDDTACYGDYYQWGRNTDGHEKSTSSSTSSRAGDVANVGHGNFITNSTFPFDWASVDVAGAGRTGNWSATDGSSVCPTGFRVPNIAELKAELLDVGSAEIASYIDAFNSFLKFPSPGYRTSSSGSFNSRGGSGYVWTSSVNGLESTYVYFYFSDGRMDHRSRASGISVRCLRD